MYSVDRAPKCYRAASKCARKQCRFRPGCIKRAVLASHRKLEITPLVRKKAVENSYEYN